MKLTGYLGGPINGCTDSEANDWRDELMHDPVLAERFNWLNPMVRDYRGRELEPGIDAAIVRGDLSDIECSHFGIFYCPKPSWGTAMEIYHMSQVLGKKVIVVHSDSRPPSPWLTRHSWKLVKDFQEARKVLHTL